MNRSPMRRCLLVLVILGLCLTCFVRASARAADYGIFVVATDGTQLRKVAQVDGYDYHAAPRWSRDGRRLAFDVRPGPEYNRAKIYLVNVDGTGLREFAEEANCDWSPDDRQIVLSVYGGHRDKEGIYVQNVDGGGREFLVDGGSPRWNADGSRIAFTDWRTLKCLDLVSGEVENLLDVELEERPFQFDWAPDGKRLAFVARQKGAKSRELYIIDATQPVRELKPRWATPVSFPGFVAWSPDGKQLAINAGYYIHLLDVEGNGQPKRLPGQTDRSYEPHFSPDGKSIAFARRPVPKS